MKRTFSRLDPGSRWLALGFGGVVVGLGLSMVLAYRNTSELIGSSGRSLFSYEVINNLSEVMGALTVAESGRRGYIFLNDFNELERYQTAEAQIEVDLGKLRRQLAGDGRQMKLLTDMDGLIQVRLRLLRRSVVLYNQNPGAMAEQVRLTQESVGLRDRIQGLWREIKAVEEGRLRQGLNQTQSSQRRRVVVEGLLIGSMFATLVVGGYAFYRQVVGRQAVEMQRRSLAQAGELSELKLRFFSMVSHEFRTPLSVILGSTQLLLEGQEKLGEKPMNNLRRIQWASRSMKQLLSDILMLTRAEAGKLEFQPERLELVSFCLNLIEDLQLDPKFVHDVQFENRGTVVNAMLDEKLVYSILSNLLGNSIKYSQAGSVILFVLSGDARCVEFMIKDRGVGIPEADLLFLYEPFYRGTNVPGVAGTGLGLAVVKKSVELHGGEILVESEVGVGTTFWVRIAIG